MLHRLLVTLRRRLALDRNPMRRRLDRAETWLSVFTVLVLLAVAPVVGAACADHRRADQRAHASPGHRVTATVAPGPARAVPENGSGPRTAREARWTAPDGTPRQGVVSVPVDAGRGRTTTIWTDAHGDPVPHPRTAAQIDANASVFGAFAGLAVLLGGLGVVWAGHRLLDRRRFADWDAQWDRIAPRWMRQY